MTGAGSDTILADIARHCAGPGWQSIWHAAPGGDWIEVLPGADARRLRFYRRDAVCHAEWRAAGHLDPIELYLSPEGRQTMARATLGEMSSADQALAGFSAGVLLEFIHAEREAAAWQEIGREADRLHRELLGRVNQSAEGLGQLAVDDDDEIVCRTSLVTDGHSLSLEAFGQLLTRLLELDRLYRQAQHSALIDGFSTARQLRAA